MLFSYFLHHERRSPAQKSCLIREGCLARSRPPEGSTQRAETLPTSRSTRHLFPRYLPIDLPLAAPLALHGWVDCDGSIETETAMWPFCCCDRSASRYQRIVALCIAEVTALFSTFDFPPVQQDLRPPRVSAGSGFGFATAGVHSLCPSISALPATAVDSPLLMAASFKTKLPRKPHVSCVLCFLKL